MTKTWTVVGVWLNDQAVTVGVIEGEHEVHGGDDAAFGDGVDALVEDGQGLWATSVDAPDVETAEALAVEEMENAEEVRNEGHMRELPQSFGDYSDEDDLMIGSAGLLTGGDQT